jgi:hypothetical protein
LNILIDEKVMLLRVKELSSSESDAELTKKVDEIKESCAFNDGFDKIMKKRKVDYAQWKEELRKRIILEKSGFSRREFESPSERKRRGKDISQMAEGHVCSGTKGTCGSDSRKGVRKGRSNPEKVDEG